MIEARQRQIKLVHELMYQIKVHEAMTVEVACFPPSATFREIQQILKEKKISGAPIVEGGRIVGIVSIDDIITAFDHNRIDEPVTGYMVRSVVTIPKDYSLIVAANMFQRYRFGRLPVTDRPGDPKLAGIITYGDILSRLVLEINTIAERFEHEVSEETPLRVQPKRMRFDIAPDDFERAGMASTTIKKRLKEMGVAPEIVRRIAVICYEAEMNVVIHSLGGFMDIEVEPGHVRIQVVDEGPGISDVEQALTAGYTTASEKIRALGFGAGMGLSNIKRCADRFHLESSLRNGTELEAVVLLPRDAPPTKPPETEKESTP